MARALRRVLAASAVSATLLAPVAPSEAAAPAAPGCREIREPVTGMWWIIC